MYIKNSAFFTLYQNTTDNHIENKVMQELIKDIIYLQIQGSYEECLLYRLLAIKKNV